MAELSLTLGGGYCYSPNFTVHGRALNIDQEGALLLETDLGEQVRILSGDVRLRCRRIALSGAGPRVVL